MLITRELRQNIRFEPANLTEKLPEIGQFNVIFLRNVLIYFDPPTKAEVVDRVLTQLRPDGILFLGTAEGRVPCRTPLKVLAPLLCGHVAAGGSLVLAGILERQADELKQAYAPWCELQVADAEDGWILMTASF